MAKSSFKEDLLKHNISLSEEQLVMFDKYYKLLVTENEKYNLTAITEEDDVYDKHFYDSISILFYYDLSNKKSFRRWCWSWFPINAFKDYKPIN